MPSPTAGATRVAHVHVQSNPARTVAGHAPKSLKTGTILQTSKRNSAPETFWGNHACVRSTENLGDSGHHSSSHLHSLCADPSGPPVHWLHDGTLNLQELASTVTLCGFFQVCFRARRSINPIAGLVYCSTNVAER